MKKVKKKIRKYLLDSNIYGEVVVDKEIGELKEYYQSCRNIVLVYGIKEIIRKELRATPKDSKVGKAKLRSNLLALYDIFTGNHELSICRKSQLYILIVVISEHAQKPLINYCKLRFLTTEEHKQLANEYYVAYRKFSGSKSKEVMFNDLLIVACASSKSMDVVVSEDEKTMLTENAIKAYKFANNAKNERTPIFIGYNSFKLELRSCFSNKFVGSSNKLWILLVFLNIFYQFVKINFFPFHKLFKIIYI